MHYVMGYVMACRKMSHVSLDQGGDGQLTPGLRLMAGAMAGIVGMSATYPMDMVSAGLRAVLGHLEVERIGGVGRKCRPWIW